MSLRRLRGTLGANGCCFSSNRPILLGPSLGDSGARRMLSDVAVHRVPILFLIYRRRGYALVRCLRTCACGRTSFGDRRGPHI